MNDHLRTYMTIFLLPLFFGLHSCKKEDSLHPVWITYSAEEIGLVDQREFNICSDVSGNIYAVQATDAEGVFLLSYHERGDEGWQVTEFPFVQQDPMYVTDENHMKSTSDGSVWFMGAQEMLRLKDGAIVQRYPLGHLIGQGSGVGVTRFATYGVEVWLLHWSYGLFQLNTETGETLSFQDPGYGGANTLLSIDSKGNRWIVKQNYPHNVIALASDGSWETVNDPDSLIGCPACPSTGYGVPAYDDFRGMVSDAVGNTYLHSTNYQLLRISNGTVQSMALSIGPNYDAMTIDHDNKLWFYKTGLPPYFSGDSRIYRYNGSSSTTVVDLTNAFDGNIWPYDMTFDHNNNAWVATNMGIAVYNENGVML